MTVETRLFPIESNEFKNKNVLITGGSSGIGLETARIFHLNKAHVIVFDVQPKPDFLVGSNYHQVDVGNFDQVNDVVSAVTKEFGGIDVVVNNAAVKYAGNILEITQEQMEQMLRVNALGFWNIAKTTMPHIINSQGTLINVCSGTSENLPPNTDGYFSSKGLTYSLTNALRSTFANENIKIVGVAPGPVDTPLWREGKSEESLKASLSGNAGPEVLKPENIAEVIIGLASKNNRSFSNPFYRF